MLALANARRALCIVPQFVYEFWVVATRPIEVNGLGMNASAANRSVDQSAEEFRLLKDERGVFGQWRTLVSDFQVTGKTAHDARLVAAMLQHGVTQLLTFNKSDFSRFTGIQVVTPAEVLQEQIPA